MSLSEILNRAKVCPANLSERELEYLLSLSDPNEIQELFNAAYSLKLKYIGRKVSIRGLIEIGNKCAKNCFYCGIRKDNHNVHRYQFSENDVIHMARRAWEQGFGSLVLQSGEIESDQNTFYIESILKGIHEFAGDSFGITLSLGEQSEDVYRRWKNAGAHRYLLRIETSDPELYQRIHPATHSYSRREECLHHLKKLGYQLGTGVMIGFPGQTIANLAHDILFFHKIDADMIGMGPYIPHHQTPMGKDIVFDQAFAERQLLSGLKMIAVTRLYLHDVNIAATTALQTLSENGRERGLSAGANVIMPNVTDLSFRKDYQLYENKPDFDENSETAREKLNKSMASLNEEILWFQRGDSKHFYG